MPFYLGIPAYTTTLTFSLDSGPRPVRHRSDASRLLQTNLPLGIGWRGLKVLDAASKVPSYREGCGIWQGKVVFIKGIR
jgi:hypothetical protein